MPRQQSGDVVRCVDQTGAVIAQGLSNYSAVEVDAIKGVASDKYRCHRLRRWGRGTASRQLVLI